MYQVKHVITCEQTNMNISICAETALGTINEDLLD